MPDDLEFIFLVLVAVYYYFDDIYELITGRPVKPKPPVKSEEILWEDLSIPVDWHLDWEFLWHNPLILDHLLSNLLGYSYGETRHDYIFEENHPIIVEYCERGFLDALDGLYDDTFDPTNPLIWIFDEFHLEIPYIDLSYSYGWGCFYGLSDDKYETLYDYVLKVSDLQSPMDEEITKLLVGWIELSGAAFSIFFILLLFHPNLCFDFVYYFYYPSIKIYTYSFILNLELKKIKKIFSSIENLELSEIARVLREHKWVGTPKEVRDILENIERNKNKFLPEEEKQKLITEMAEFRKRLKKK